MSLSNDFTMVKILLQYSVKILTTKSKTLTTSIILYNTDAGYLKTGKTLKNKLNLF